MTSGDKAPEGRVAAEVTASLPTGGVLADQDGALRFAEGAVATREGVLRLHAEEVSVARRTVEGRVQVHVHTVTREHAVDEALAHERVEVERVAIGRPVDAIPPDRQEGDTTVISVVEEVVVIQRQLVLREEVRLRRVRVTERHRETVSLRAQEAVVERSGLPAGGAMPKQG